ncbi:MAG: HesA/MoeB/ThiF family protein [Kiritimatiellae bacterium]|nr:HesA/MoeB/ThiF family protein [Kiritimatiellia bacterium]
MSDIDEKLAASGRYARQTALSMIGTEGQRRISAATALVVGCGALGSTQAAWLARAGVGRLLLVDRDIVETHNLHRQMLYDGEDARARRPKVVAAANRLRAVNPEVCVEPTVDFVTAENVIGLVRQADVVLDAADNAATRYLVNDACVREGKPWMYGGVMGTSGAAMAVIPRKGPCLRCVFHDPASVMSGPCATFGVLSTIVGWVAAMQVTAALKLLVGAPPDPARLHRFDIWSGHGSSAIARRDQRCVCCGQNRYEFLGEMPAWDGGQAGTAGGAARGDARPPGGGQACVGGRVSSRAADAAALQPAVRRLMEGECPHEPRTPRGGVPTTVVPAVPVKEPRHD